MSTIYENGLADLRGLSLHARAAEVLTWQGRRALRLDGLVVIPDILVPEACIEVQIGCDSAAYPGIAFHIQDQLNYELAYAQPHTSGKWDALQYDPVFHGSNTWQLYHGEAYQKATAVPLGEWFAFKVEFKEGWAAVRVGEQSPLIVERLAHQHRSGLVGFWTYLPAYFGDLCASECQSTPVFVGSTSQSPTGVLNEWFLEDFGRVACEPNGILNLNRYLPATVSEARLTRRFEAFTNESVKFTFGFSDNLSLQLDDEVLFTGQNTYSDSLNWSERGYVDFNQFSIQRSLAPGIHRLTAVLKVSEPFGWGLSLVLRGGKVRLLAVEAGEKLES